MASKNLARTGASLVNRFFPNPFLRQSPNPNPNQWIVSQGLDVTPKLFPSLSKFENSLHLPQYQNDAELIRKVASEGFVYPSGLPSLSFYLPEGDVSSSNEPMILFPKWTFQPSTIRCKRDHGFFARKATKGGRRVIPQRIAKGRFRITA
ncbi:hypothetical protein RGQ29_021347 [Quercus rubra]|uniref:Large ribosomal subunit protein bL34m n=1 Tax=Quercus rubra TaxID=3512 RepID=A0AAN7IYC2_QUERU|nr:hypothetical protein RGQ29_021347 [Quercus rubra]KAK4591117.1 hypothetical protein RGQ29_021347 [Quercus rubra]